MVANPAGQGYCGMATRPQPEMRTFHQVQLDLEDVLRRMKTALDPKFRAKLLRELRLLLEEADLIMESS